MLYEVITVCPAQDRDVAASLGEEIGVREEESFRIRFGRSDLRQQLIVGQSVCVVAEIRVAIERGPDSYNFV